MILQFKHVRQIEGETKRRTLCWLLLHYQNNLITIGSMKPIVSDYINVFQFLQDHYAYRKRTETQFSYSIWAQELGFKNKSYIRFVTLGKRPISPKLLENLKVNLSLDNHEKKFSKFFVIIAKAAPMRGK